MSLKRPLFAGAAFVALTVVAAGFVLAQTPAVRSAPLPAASQAPGTIVTSGRGSVRIPADRVLFEIRLQGRPNSGSLDDAGKALAQILVQNGIADARWVIPFGGYSNAATGPVLVGSLAHPTRADMEAKIRATLKAVPDSLAPSLANYQITSTFEADDCDEAETRAIAAALDEARRRARETAKAAGLQLGGVVAVNAIQLYGTGCPTKPARQYAQNGGGLADPLAEPYVDIEAMLNVTFAAAP